MARIDDSVVSIIVCIAIFGFSRDLFRAPRKMLWRGNVC